MINKRIFIFVLVSLSVFSFAQDRAGEYTLLKEQITKEREVLSVLYSTTGVDKDSVISLAQKFLFKKIVNDIFPAWYNTEWSFNGMTRLPGTGSIVCGYFVTTVLVDAGFLVPRVKWAQLPSEKMILKLNSEVKRFRGSTVEKIIEYIRTAGEGLYIVGLDIHVGFIVNDGSEISFVHSNYYRPEIGVMREKLTGKNPLADSKYRVIGRILHKDMVVKWLQGKAWEN